MKKLTYFLGSDSRFAGQQWHHQHQARRSDLQLDRAALIPRLQLQAFGEVCKKLAVAEHLARSPGGQNAVLPFEDQLKAGSKSFTSLSVFSVTVMNDDFYSQNHSQSFLKSSTLPAYNCFLRQRVLPHNYSRKAPVSSSQFSVHRISTSSNILTSICYEAAETAFLV